MADHVTMFRLKSSYALLVLTLLACSVLARLGVWQLSRLDQRRAANAQRERTRALAPVDLPAVPGAGDYLEHPAVAYGHFLTAPSFTLINHSLRGAPGVEIVNTFELAGGALVLVDRGFVPLESRFVAPVPPTGPVTLRGFLFTAVNDDRAPHPQGLKGDDWVRLAPAEMGAATGRTFLPYALAPTHNTGDGRFPIVKKLQAIDEGPHLSYAIQWFAFAAIFLVGGLLLLISRERKA
jgi:surfeit locus 1 family protein